MWFQCIYCEMILPLYEVDPVSAKYIPMKDWICGECAWDLSQEHCDYPDDDPCYPEEFDLEDEEEEEVIS